MTKKFPYWHWMVGALIAWAIVLLLTWRLINSHSFHEVVIFFGGFVLGALEATLAHKVSRK